MKWVNCIYIKDASWSTYEAPNQAGWALKYVCNAKNEMIRGTQETQWMTCNTFSIKRYYQQLVEGSQQMQWSNRVWNRYIMPKHMFILWLAVQDRLKTRSRLMQLNLSDSDACLICQQNTENATHLFIEFM